MKGYDVAFIMVLIFVVYMVSGFILIEAHERTHQQIYRAYGCDSVITYNFDFLSMGGMTQAVNCSLPSPIFEEVLRLQLETEVRDYSAHALNQSMWCMVFVLVGVMIIAGGREHEI